MRLDLELGVLLRHNVFRRNHALPLPQLAQIVFVSEEELLVVVHECGPRVQSCFNKLLRLLLLVILVFPLEFILWFFGLGAFADELDCFASLGKRLVPLSKLLLEERVRLQHLIVQLVVLKFDSFLQCLVDDRDLGIVNLLLFLKTFIQLLLGF